MKSKRSSTNNFICEVRSESGECRRFLVPCESRPDCRARNRCGECIHYQAPSSQDPCCECENLMTNFRDRYYGGTEE